MRRKHYALGAVILTVGAATMVLLSKAQNGGLSGLAYLPGGMQQPFSAAPTMPVTVEAPAMPESQPEVTIAEIPTSAPIEAPVVVALAHTTPPGPEIPTATNAPSDTPVVQHGSAGNGQSRKGTGSGSANSSDSSTSSGGGGSGGGGSGGGGSSGGSNTQNSPLTLENPPVLTNDNPQGNNGGGAPGGTGPIGEGGPSFIFPPGPDTGDPKLGGPTLRTFAPEQETVTVDEPGPLSLLLVGALGLLAARRRAKRDAA